MKLTLFLLSTLCFFTFNDALRAKRQINVKFPGPRSVATTIYADEIEKDDDSRQEQQYRPSLADPYQGGQYQSSPQSQPSYRPQYSSQSQPQQPSSYRQQGPSSSGLTKEEEAEENKPSKLELLLVDSKFGCKERKDGYYADESVNCQVFHYCVGGAKHSWMCPEGTVFHQVHLNCVPNSQDICSRSEKFFLVNDYLHKELDQRGPNNTILYSQRYYPEEFLGDALSAAFPQTVTYGNPPPTQSKPQQQYSGSSQNYGGSQGGYSRQQQPSSSYSAQPQSYGYQPQSSYSPSSGSSSRGSSSPSLSNYRAPQPKAYEASSAEYRRPSAPSPAVSPYTGYSPSSYPTSQSAPEPKQTYSPTVVTSQGRPSLYTPSSPASSSSYQPSISSSSQYSSPSAGYSPSSSSSSSPSGYSQPSSSSSGSLQPDYRSISRQSAPASSSVASYPTYPSYSPSASNYGSASASSSNGRLRYGPSNVNFSPYNPNNNLKSGVTYEEDY